LRSFIPLLAVTFFLGAIPAEAVKQETITSSATAKHIQIPFFFVTDRNVIDPKSKDGDVELGGKRQHLGPCPHDPNMGIGSCVIDNIRSVELDAQHADLKWVDSPDAKEGEFKLSLLPETDFSQREAAFYAQIVEAAKKTPDHEIEIFVPGYMSTFRSGAESAARFAYYSKHPVILYSWPSKGSWKDYSSDEASVEWSQPHFNRMIDKLTEIANANQFKFRMYSHSMGNRLVLRSATHLRENHAFTEVAMICPDLDDGIALHYLADYASPNGTTKGRLYMSRKDRALVLSQMVHGGYLRFGQETGSAGLLPSEDGTPNEELSKHRFQSIDFTAIDQGKIGHKIPVALICNMSAHGEAPAGLRLLETSQYRQTRAAKIIERASHITPDKSVDPHYLVQIDESDKQNAKFYKPHKLVFQTIRRKDWSLK
jgi:hypothetical protein